MTDTIKYRIYCNTEDVYVSAWASEPLTVCPNSAAHTVNPLSVQEIDYEHQAFVYVSPLSTSNTEYTKVFSFDYSTHTLGPFRRLTINARCEGPSDTFNVKLVDYTNQLTLMETALQNSAENVSLNVGTTELAPNTHFFLEMCVKSPAGCMVIIDQIILDASEL
jgi:hypothetical protein